MTRIAVVGVPGKWSTEHLADVLGEMTGFRCVVDMARVTLDLGSGRATFGEVELSELDGVVVKKLGETYSPEDLDRLEVLRAIRARGVPVFSRPDRVMRLLDRLSCTVTLREHDIPMPETFVTEDVAAAVAAVRRFGRAVLKPLFSTKARGMELVEAGEGLEEQIARFKADGHRTMYLQRRIDLPGKDLGVAFLGGQHLGTYARVRGGTSWSTVVAAGGRYEPYDAPEAIVELARRAQAPFGLDFTSVDVGETEEGPVVFEVSAFGGFHGLKECGIDAAERYARYIVEKVSHGA